ncbi:hypothetical protein ALC53_09903 [Atta colombica]|uniref:Uncharacterized protein n=1 Tax=Atta colombica TaxID=520822 RepID=A0A151I0Z3_9HYME|nr:hypothetical protein ALC53_09903 [Atta colombica]
MTDVQANPGGRLQQSEVTAAQQTGRQTFLALKVQYVGVNMPFHSMFLGEGKPGKGARSHTKAWVKGEGRNSTRGFSVVVDATIDNKTATTRSIRATVESVCVGRLKIC